MNTIFQFRRVVIFIFLFLSLITNAQHAKFSFLKKKKKEKVSFSLVNNVIVLPIKVNGVTLRFILDSGVNKTILFHLSEIDSLRVENHKTLTLQGLGEGEGVNAIHTVGNRIEVGSITSDTQDIYVLTGQDLNISSKFGFDIHGVIGYDIFKDFIVEINYDLEKISFHNPLTFNKRKLSKYVKCPLLFIHKKPHIQASIMINNYTIPVSLLLDTGGSDAIWLFEQSHDSISVGEESFKDVLGSGLNGDIYGDRTRLERFSVGTFNFYNPTVSIPDSTAIGKSYSYRNGSLGGDLLRRFTLYFDYRNRVLYLKKARSFNESFYFDMSGFTMEYIGEKILKSSIMEYANSFDKGFSTSSIPSIKFSEGNKFSKIFMISSIVEGSPAADAGLLKGDIILSINGEEVTEAVYHKYLLLFTSAEGKKIILKIDRSGKVMKKQFKLKKRI